MKHVVSVLVLGALLVTGNGCANGPLKRFFRGAPCNACNPPLAGGFGQGWGGGSVTNCDNGVCSTPPATMGAPLPAPATSAAKPPLEPYSYPGTSSLQPPEGVLTTGLTPIDTLPPAPWQNRVGAVGSGASFNDYVSPPSPGSLPGPSGNR